MNKIAFLVALVFTSLSGALSAESVQDYFDEMSEEPPEISQGPDTQGEDLIYGPRLFDLEDTAQDFVLETKQIHLPHFPTAFNPSIIDWEGGYLLSFRAYAQNGSTNTIGLVLLDLDCNLVTEPQVLEIPADPYCHFKRQDPRLISINKRLYIVYNNHLKTIVDREIRRMLVAEVLYDGKTFRVEKQDIFLNFEGEAPTRTEKNWVPFDYNGNLMLSYSIILTGYSGPS